MRGKGSGQQQRRPKLQICTINRRSRVDDTECYPSSNDVITVKERPSSPLPAAVTVAATATAIANETTNGNGLSALLGAYGDNDDDNDDDDVCARDAVEEDPMAAFMREISVLDRETSISTTPDEATSVNNAVTYIRNPKRSLTNVDVTTTDAATAETPLKCQRSCIEEEEEEEDEDECLNDIVEKQPVPIDDMNDAEKSIVFASIDTLFSKFEYIGITKHVSDGALLAVHAKEYGTTSYGDLLRERIRLGCRLDDYFAGWLPLSALAIRIRECANKIQLEELVAAPEGWLCQWSDIDHRYYYSHPASGTARWDYPPSSVVRAAKCNSHEGRSSDVVAPPTHDAPPLDECCGKWMFMPCQVRDVRREMHGMPSTPPPPPGSPPDSPPPPPPPAPPRPTTSNPLPLVREDCEEVVVPQLSKTTIVDDEKKKKVKRIKLKEERVRASNKKITSLVSKWEAAQRTLETDAVAKAIQAQLENDDGAPIEQWMNDIDRYNLTISCDLSVPPSAPFSQTLISKLV